jgi:hypothetical protein
MLWLVRKKSSIFIITSHESPQQNELKNAGPQAAGDWTDS